MNSVRRDVINQIQEALVETCREEMKRLTGPKPGFSNRQAGDMQAGFEDGVRATIGALVASGILVIADGPVAATEAEVPS